MGGGGGVEPTGALVVRGCRSVSPTQALAPWLGSRWGWGIVVCLLACVRGAYAGRGMCAVMHSVPLPRLSTLQGPCSSTLTRPGSLLMFSESSTRGVSPKILIIYCSIF